MYYQSTKWNSGQEVCGMRALVIAAMLLILWLASADSRTWHVLTDGTGDAPTLQAAIDSAQAGDTVIVGSGIHGVEHMLLCSSKSNLAILGEEPEGSATISGTTDDSLFEVEWSSNIIIKRLVFSNCPLSLDWTFLSLLEYNIFCNLSPILVIAGGSNEIRNNKINSCGTGIFCADYTDVSIHHNLIVYNTGTSAPGDGCGILLDAGSYSIFCNIIVNNNWGIRSNAMSMNINCNNVWGNQIKDYDLEFLPDPTGTNGNISADPQFCGVSPELSGNFYLQSDSPCAPGNHPNGFECGLIGRYPVGCGATSSERSSWGSIKAMFK
jgi:hypothetical protein